MAEKRSEIPCFLYLYIHSRIWEAFSSDKISIKDFSTYLFEWRLPKILRPLIIKEMQILGLITRTGKYEIKLSRPNFEILEYNKYYQDMGIF